MRALPLLLLLAAPARSEHSPNAGGDSVVVSAAQGAYLYSAQPGPYGLGTVILRRLSPDGGLYWSETYGRGQGEEVTALGVAADGGVVLGGARKKGCFLARWDGSGRLGFEIAPEPYGQCRPAAVLTDATGSAYVLATVSNNSGGFDAVVLAFNPKGDQRWRFRYPAAGTVYARNLVLDPRGDRLRGYVLRRDGAEFLEEFFRLDLEGRRLDR